jgi:hypothetical protein
MFRADKLEIDKEAEHEILFMTLPNAVHFIFIRENVAESGTIELQNQSDAFPFLRTAKQQQ